MQNRCRAEQFSTQHDKDIRYLEQRIADLEKLMEAKFEAQQQAVEAAEVITQARFESVNEFRATIAKQVQNFALQESVNTDFQNQSERIGSLEERMAGYDGRIIGWSAGSAAIVLILAIIAQLTNLGG